MNPREPGPLDVLLILAGCIVTGFLGALVGVGIACVAKGISP